MTASILKRVMARSALAMTLAVGAGCTDTGQDTEVFPLFASGSRMDGAVAAQGNWALTVTRAELAFGPLVLCAGYQAGELCDVARAEWLGSARINVLDRTPMALGNMRGTSGMTRSWMYDLAIVSVLTQEEPVTLAAAAALGGNSVVIEGAAERDGVLVPFTVALGIQQQEQTEAGVPVVRKSASDVFEHEINDDGASLTVVFDAAPWLAGIDLDVMLASEACSADNCADGVVLELDSQGGRAVNNAIVAGARPQFLWGAAPQ